MSILKNLLSKKQEGLMTPNRLQIKLLETIADNIDKLENTRQAKIQIEKQLLENNLNLNSDTQTEQLLSIIYQETDLKLLVNVLKKEKQSKRIINILKKRNEIKPTKPIQDLISFYETLNRKKYLKQIKECIKLQNKYLKKKKYEDFMKYYQREKTFATEILTELNKFELGQIADEIVRSGFDEKVIENKISQYFTAGSGLLVSATAVPITSVGESPSQFLVSLIWPIALILIVNKGHYGKRTLKERVEYLLNFAKENFSENTFQANKKSVLKKYNQEIIIKGVKISGVYDDPNIKDVETCFEKYTEIELKRFLKEILFLDKKSEEYGKKTTGGDYFPSLKKIRIFPKGNTLETIEHEVAHARDYGVPKELRGLFDKINKVYGQDRKNVKRIIKKINGTPVWAIDGKELSPRFGYAMPYGTKDIIEDIATMQELITVNQYEGLPPIYYNDFTDYIQVYQKKAETLYRFGFVTKQQLRDFIKYIHGGK